MISEAALAKRRERDRLKKARRLRRREAEKLAALTIGRSKTDPAYRRQLPALPEMSKSELRAMITQAVRNTAGVSA